MSKLKIHFCSLNYILFASAACSIALISVVMFFSTRGIDLVDESYYLASILNPTKYKFLLSQFGFIYNYLFWVSDGSISTLRQLNLIITFALAWILSWLALKSTLRSQAGGWLPRLVIAAALGTTSLAMLRLWLPTPSYNWLAFQALMLTAIGLLLSGSHGRIRMVGWALIAVGGWLCFMAKPTTAVIAGLLSLLYLFSTKKISIALATAVTLLFCAILTATALILDGSLSGFVERFSVGLKRAGSYGMGHTLWAIFRIDPLPIDWPALRVMAIGCSLIIGSSTLALSQNKTLQAIANLLCVICAALTILLISGFIGGPYDYGLLQQMFLISIGASCVIFALFYNKRNPNSLEPGIQCKNSVLIGSLPLAFVFGTANNYWFMAGLVGFFGVLSGITFIRVRLKPANLVAVLMPFAFGAQLVTAGQILFGVEKPYYQPGSLRTADYLVDLGDRGRKLRVAPSMGLFIETVQRTANEAGFRLGTPVIDLTGHSPGVLYVMGASATGQPWLIGNFPMMPGSNGVATEVLKGVPCAELSRAWLLIEPEGPYSFPSMITSVFGADQQRDFSVAGSFSSADPLSNFTQTRTQYLMRPNRSIEEALLACNEAKTTFAQPSSID